MKKKNLPKIEAGVYSKTTLNEQVVFAIHYLEKYGVTVTVEEVVSTCFRLFPQSFSLKHYTRWPDSALVIRRLNDSRERGFVKGNPQDGFALKYSGMKLAERTAKVLGLVKTVPLKKKAVLPRSKVKKIPPVEKIKKGVLPVVKYAPPVKKIVKPVKQKWVKPKAVVVEQVIEQKPVVVKKAAKKAVVHVPVISKSPAKVQPVKKKITKKIIKPVLEIAKKDVEKKRKEIPVVQKPLAKSQPVKKQKSRSRKPQPVQIAMLLPAKEVQPVQKRPARKKGVPVPPLTKLQAIQPEMTIPVKAKPVTVPVVSKEEKVKAEKIVRAMERSDAYKLYSKNGHASKPSEFDFRNMLFATMESTSETLVRNVNLFKGSAAIHNRQDLIKFLDFCETNFAGLLKPSVKKIVKKK